MTHIFCDAHSWKSSFKSWPWTCHHFSSMKFQSDAWLGKVMWGPMSPVLGWGKYAWFGEMIQFDKHIFQTGWNHQLAKCLVSLVLLMEEIPNNHLGCVKPCKWWDKLPTSTGAGFFPSTVAFSFTMPRTPYLLGKSWSPVLHHFRSNPRCCLCGMAILWVDQLVSKFPRHREGWRWGIGRDTVDGRNPTNQLRLVVYPIIYRVLYIPGGTGFLNHQQ